MYTAQDLINLGYEGYRGWGDAEANADFQATGGRGKEGFTGGDTSAMAAPYFSREEREQAERDALEKLRPYYEEILKESRGDVELAKKRMEEDYTLGRRYRTEDLTTEEANWRTLEPQELAQLLERKNQMGTFYSTIRTQEEKELGEKQARRQEAVRRALGRREELAGVERGRTLEDIGIKQPRYERGLEEEKRTRAFELADISELKKGQRSMAELTRFLLPEEFTRQT